MAGTEGDEAAIGALLTAYQRAVREGDAAGFGRTFHQSALVSFPDSATGALSTMTAEEFAADCVQLVADGTTVVETPRSTRIDVAGDVASARVDFHLQIGDESFAGTDFYSLARVGGRWVVTQKLYDMTPEA